MKLSKRAIYIIVILFGVVTLIAMTILPVYQDWAFNCEKTGSRKGYREWFCGTKTGHWYKESKLEEFMKTNYPDVLSYRWVSYAGEGKNIFGKLLFSGHGRPELAHLRYDFLNRYVEHINDQEKRKLYDLFASADAKRIKDEVFKISEKVLELLQSDNEPLKNDSQ